MTKYEEAYKRLYHDIESVYADLKILGELVERDTPKPLDYEGDGYVDGELNF